MSTIIQPATIIVDGSVVPNYVKIAYRLDIDGLTFALPPRLFRVFALLAIGRLTKADGWLTQKDLGLGPGLAPQYVWRTSASIHTIIGHVLQSGPNPVANRLRQWTVHESTSDGKYRLQAAPASVQIKPSILSLQDAELEAAWKALYPEAPITS